MASSQVSFFVFALLLGSIKGYRDRDCTSWFLANGGKCNGIKAVEIDGQGMGLVTTRPVKIGEVVMQTPIDLCLAASRGPEWLRTNRGPSISASSVVSLLLLELQRSKKHLAYLDTLPTPEDIAGLPVLWNDQEAQMLQGTQSGVSRQELLDAWRSDFEAVQLRHCPFDIDWPSWLKAHALVMSRSYNLPEIDYALVPFLDYINHSDEPSAEPLFYEEHVQLRIIRDLPEGTQLFSSYSGTGHILDGLKMFQAFGWLEPGLCDCNIDLLEALRRDDTMAEHKIQQLLARPDQGRLLLTLSSDKATSAQSLSEAIDSTLLPSLEIISGGSQSKAIQTGITLLDRKIKALDHSASIRESAALRDTTLPLRRELAKATASGERLALNTLRTTLKDLLDSSSSLI